jgi:hypothetical protein
MITAGRGVIGTGLRVVLLFALGVGIFSVTRTTLGGANQTRGFELTAGRSFSITSTITPYPSCSGGTVSLDPGIQRCITYTIHNSLTAPITVQTVSIAIDSANPPPVTCPASNLDLTSANFSGSLSVPAEGSASTPGEQISMVDSFSSQNPCEGVTFNFVYSGTAYYTDSTTTSLAATPNPSPPGTSVTFTATVDASNPSVDTSSPGGTVSFYVCPTSACSSTTLLGTGTLNPSNGQATYSVSDLPAVITYVEAVYQGSSTDFTGSTSNVVTQVVSPS